MTFLVFQFLLKLNPQWLLDKQMHAWDETYSKTVCTCSRDSWSTHRQYMSVKTRGSIAVDTVNNLNMILENQQKFEY